MSRNELFEEVERKALKTLPIERFGSEKVKILTVQINYHVELREDRHYYSVPYYLRRRGRETKVKIIYDERTVAIYYDNIRVAQHRRDRTPNAYTTLPEHMPPNHRYVAEWSADRFLQWAQSVGEDVALVVGKVLESRKHPEQAFKVCMGLLNLPKEYRPERVNKACRRAHDFGIYSYTRIKNILERGLDEELSPLESTEVQIPAHENVRGSHYYNLTEGGRDEQ